MDEARESQQLLTSAEEKALTERIHQMTVTGHPPTYNLIREIAHELRQHRFVGINEAGVQHVEFEPIGHLRVRLTAARVGLRGSQDQDLGRSDGRVSVDARGP
jgi:hypothetical protein